MNRSNGGGSGVLNPFSSFGLSDQDYVGMLQGIAMEKEGKRELEVVRGDGTVRFQEGKSRARASCHCHCVLRVVAAPLLIPSVPLTVVQ